MPVLCDVKVWLDRYDLSGALNSIAMENGVEGVDDTTFDGSCTRTVTAGLWVSRMSHAGFWQSDAQPDLEIDRRLGLSNTPISVAPVPGQALGTTAYFMNSLVATYNPNGAVGDQFAFTVGAESQDRMIRGTLLHNSVETTTGFGTGFNFKAVAAGEMVGAALHVLAPVTGTTPVLAAKLESAPDDTFASPTSRITFTNATGPTAQYQTTDGSAITDTWWRVAFDITGTTPSFPFVVTAGIIVP